MRITDALLGEHGVFYAQFGALERETPRATTLEQVRAQAALLQAALESHARIENDLLFAALEPSLGGQGPLAVMRHEHDQIEGGLAAVQTAGGLAPAQELLLHVVATARSHFAKEEQILFPMARQALTEAEQARLAEAWAERRQVVVV